MTAPCVLVADGHLRASLAVVRSLGRAGYRVYVCSPRRRSLAGASRFALGEAEVPEALSQPERFAEAVAALTRQWGIDVLLPISEESLLAILPVIDQMPGVRVPFSTIESFRMAADKQHVTAVAATLGISVPEQVVVPSADAARSIDVGDLPFPLVIKPARSVAGEAADRVKMGVSYVNNRAELDALVHSIPSNGYPLLVQRRIEGPGTGVFLLIWDGQPIAQFAHRRIREKPPSGGVSVLAESISADPATVRQSEALLSALNWRGPAMVEFKQDRVTGRRYLMEINGRFWGSLQLAIDAGVDFPALLVAAALGNPVTPISQYRIGVRGRWWWGEVDHLIARLKRSSDAPGMGSRTRAVQQFLWPGAGVRNEILRADDPMPFGRETIDWLRGR